MALGPGDLDCDRDLGLCDLDLGLCERDLGVLGPDLGLPDRDLGLADPDLGLPDPLLDRDLDFDLGLLDACDLGLAEPDLLLWADPERLEPAGELDLLREALEALEDFLVRADWLDFGDSLPDLAGLLDTDLKL